MVGKGAIDGGGRQLRREVLGGGHGGRWSARMMWRVLAVVEGKRPFLLR